ncbi:MAG: 50S ribosomal protein L25/general stress protein Ctc [Sphingomonadales bacterium]|nr:50S ribosomal protein L25/general stress protein Ctc [Sphingomonadales bacterium]
MSDVLSLAAEPRERAGKGSARAARRDGRIPAVIYGDKKPVIMVTLGRNELVKQYNRGTFLTSVYEIEVEGKKERVLPRDLQLHPVSDEPLHVDFLRLGKGSSIVIELPVIFTGEEDSPGLKRGGVLNVVRHAIECRCPGDAIPESLSVSLAGLDINDSVHMSAVDLPEGTVPTITDRDFTIASVVAPSIMEEPEPEEEVLEGEELPEGEEGAEEAGEGEAEDAGGEE